MAIWLEANPGDEVGIDESVRALINPTMAEPGEMLFLPYRSPTVPKSFFVYGPYNYETGWETHQQAPHFKTFDDEILPRLAWRGRIPFVRLGERRRDRAAA